MLELLRPKIFLINQVNNLLLLFTFGATSPLLSIVIVTAMIMHTMRMALVIGRFLHKEAECERRGKFKNRIGGAKQLDDECAQFSFRFLHNTRWLLVSMSSFFYAFFLMDTYGDVVGFRDALAPVIFLLCTPLLIFLYERLPDQLSRSARSENSTEAGCELSNVDEEQQQQVTNPLPEAVQGMSTSMSLSLTRMSKNDDVTPSVASSNDSRLQHSASTDTVKISNVTIRGVTIQPRSLHDSVKGANAATLIKLEHSAFN